MDTEAAGSSGEEREPWHRMTSKVEAIIFFLVDPSSKLKAFVCLCTVSQRACLEAGVDSRAAKFDIYILTATRGITRAIG